MDKKRGEFLSLEGLGAKSSPVTQQNPSLVVINPSVPIPIQLGPVSQILKCPHCEIMMESRIEKRITKQTHLFALALCLTGLICLVPLPYCLKSCQSADHFCSQCNRFLGVANF